jgi:hypothetical protein
MSLKRKNPIITYIKRKKTTLASEINDIITSNDKLSTRDIGTILLERTMKSEKLELEDHFKKYYITDISKDFNKNLTVQLLRFNIIREKKESDKNYSYFRK